jgi:uncharacterized membrane protein YfcA
MNAYQAVLLLVAGLAAGTVNAIAGGGSLITFPALLAIGLPAKAANFTNSVSSFPGHTASVYGSRADLGDLIEERGRRRILGLLPTTVVGCAIGCVLLKVTPAGAFDVIVPFLVLGATLVLACQRQLRGLVGHPAQLSGRRQAVGLHVVAGLGAVYGGYFGAALGVMLIAGLGLVLDATLVRISALKNLISAVEGGVTVLIFAFVGQVDWAAVALLAPTALVGGYLGARLARRLPARALRVVIVVFGLAVGTILLVKAFV